MNRITGSSQMNYLCSVYCLQDHCQAYLNGIYLIGNKPLMELPLMLARRWITPQSPQNGPICHLSSANLTQSAILSAKEIPTDATVQARRSCRTSP